MSFNTRNGSMYARTAGARIQAISLAVGAAVSVGATAQHAQAQPYTWGLATGGAWDTTTSNWLNNLNVSAPWVNGNAAIFGGTVSATRTITVATGGVSATSIAFNALGSSFYSIGTSGNTIALNNGSSDEAITVGSGTQGAGTYSGTGGQTITGSPLTFVNNLSITNNGTFGLTNLTIASSINRTTSGGAITVGGTGNTSISGAIGNTVTGGLTKNGSGTLNLSSISNAFTGGITVNGGVLTIATSNDAALGATSNGVTLNAGGALRFTSAFTLNAARVITINGTAASPSIIDLGMSTTQNFAASQLTGSGVLAFTQTSASTSAPTITGANSGFTGSINVGVPRTQLVGSTVSNRGFTSSTSPVTLTLSGAGTLAGVTGITLQNNNTLQITNASATNLADRVSNSAAITSNNGRISITGVGTAASSETLGNITATGYLTITPTNRFNTLTLGTITRNDLAGVFIRGVVGGGVASSTISNIVFPSAPTLAFVPADPAGLTGPVTSNSGIYTGIVPWIGANVDPTSNDPRSFATYDANGVRVLDQTNTSFFSQISTSGGVLADFANNNVSTSTPGSITGTKVINSLAVNAGATFGGTGTLKINSGAISTFSTFTFNGPTVDFGSATGYLHLGFGMNVSGASSLTGSGGISVNSLGASSSYRLALTNTVANPFTGGLYINGNSQVSFTANNQLGNDGSGNAAGAITLGGGQLLFAPSPASTVSLSDGANNRNISVNASNGTIGTTVTGAVLKIPGTISGAGQVQFGGGVSGSSSGVVELTGGANTYTGGTLVSAGILRISNPNQLGTGDVLLNGGTLQASGNLNFSSAPIVAASSTIDTNGNSITLAGGLSGSGGTAGSSANINTLTKAGTGTLTFQGTSNFAGAITVAALGGTVSIGGSASIPALTSITVGRSGTFAIDDSTTAVANRLGAAVPVTLSNGGTAGGGTLSLTTNASGSTLNFGTLTVSGGVSGNVNSSSVNIVDGGSGNNTITFAGLSGTSANNLLSFVGTTNLGRTDIPGGTRVFIAGLSAGLVSNVTFTGFGGTGQAYYDLTRGLRLIDLNLDFLNGAALQNAAPTSTATTANFRVNPSVAAIVPIYDAANTINSLRLAQGGQLDYTVGATTPAAGTNPASSVLTITGASIIAEAGTGSSITATSSAALTLTSGATALTIQADGPLSIGATIGGTGGVSKIGNAAVTVGPALANSGALAVNAGSLTLTNGAGATASIGVSAGATLTTNGAIGNTGAISVSGTFSQNANGGTATGVTVNSGGIYNLNGNLASSGSLTANGAVNLGTGTVVSATGLSGTTGAIAVGGTSFTITGASTYGGTLSGSGAIAFNPTTAVALSLGGANTGYSGTITGNANARFVLTNPAGFGTGTVDASAQTAATTFSLPTFGFNFGANTAGTLPNNIALSTTAAITVNFAAKISSGQIVTLAGVISGGNIAGTTVLTWDTDGVPQNNVLRLTNANNTFRGIIKPLYGTVAITSDGALGNAANSVDLNSDASAAGGSLRFDADNITLASTRTVTSTASSLSSINTNGFTATVAGPLAGSGAFAKIGAGTLVLSNPLNTITAAISVNAGALQIDGGIAGSGTTTAATITVNTGGTLRGSGTIGTGTTAALARNVSITAGGTLTAGGVNPGLLTINGNLSTAANSTFTADFQNTGIYDTVAVNGTVTLAGNLLVNVGPGFNPLPSDVYFLIANDSTDAVSGNFNGLLEGAIVTWIANATTYTANITYLADSGSGLLTGGNDVALYNVVPAPGVASLLAMGGILAARRRRS